MRVVVSLLTGAASGLKSEQVDRSTLVILASETFETLRAHNPL